ncbi:MAG: hypothetical protein QOG15_3346 [Solirubrobacteraceae bacterium]|nr:hypothetical protein [Solirubrobacteraceae bacterium]
MKIRGLTYRGPIVADLPSGDRPRNALIDGLQNTAGPASRMHEADQRRASDGTLTVFEASSIPTVITRLADGVILFANPACLELLGWEERDFVGKTMVEAGFWALPDRRATMLEQVADAGFVRDVEEEVRTRSGETRIVLASISSLEFRGEACLIGHIHDITERRRLEEQLRESRERFRQITETFPHGFLLADIDPPAVLYASPAVGTIFGIDLDTVYRDPLALQSLIHQADSEEVVARRDAMTGPTNLEFRIVRRDGETRWIRMRAEPVRMQDGRAARIAAVSEDITDERVLRETLRESEERFRLMVEVVEDYAILMLDVDGCVETWNTGAERIKGYAAHEIIGRHFSVFYTADDVAAGKPDRELTAARELGHLQDEGWRVRQDGTRFWANVVITPLRDADGTLRGYGKVTRDLTESRSTELELRESEERFRLLAENSTDVIGRLSLDMRIKYVSPASRSVYGYEPEAMVGRFGFEFVHPDDVAALRDDFSARDDQPGVITNTYRIIRGDGKTVWIEAKIRALRDPVSGEPIEFHTVARDVSDRRQAEADVRRAKEQAEQANNAKSEFLSRMSHELRTPLHAILGFGELLEYGSLEVDQRDQLLQMRKGGLHLLELINEVLDLARIERGDLTLSIEPVHVGQLVQETLEMVEPLAAARSVTLVPPVSDDDEVHVLADRQRLKQVLLNLLSNALKYNREGGEIRISTTHSGSPTARIEVADTGIGISAANATRAFAAFERLGAETTEIEGTGLGLALTKRLIEAMAGEIGLVSEVGRGTTFWIELPVVAAPVAEPAPSADGEPSGRPARARARLARTVLYIEDNPSNIKLVEAILVARPEIELLVATQGQLGVELAREHRPALILLDLNLPDLTGEEVLRRIRGDARAGRSAIVMLSADATPGQVERLLDAGADDYLTKPFDIEHFLAIVDAFATPRAAIL